MDIDIIQGLLGWGSVIYFVMLGLWSLMILFAHDTIYQIHSSFLDLSEERFDAIHYGGIGLYKIAILLFYLTPYVALRLAS